MSYGLSIDVGTSFTAAAVIRTGGQGPNAPQILPLGSRASAIPTVVFIGDDGTRLVGEAAERRGLAQPECVTREFKRRMGDDVPLMVGGTEVLPQDLFAAVVSWVVGVAVEREGGSPDVVTLTHPVGWGEHRKSLLRGALSDAGIHDVELLTEPEAAALSYASREQVASGSTLAVYDLGGGTFDATVVRKADADSFTVLGVPQGLERLGGADFDQEVFHSVLASAKISPADLDPSAPEVLAALNRLRRECAEAKEALSSDSEATVSVMIPGVHSQVRLVRSEFEAMIEPALAETVDTLRSALESAEVGPEDLTAILLIGGSSRIPLVAQLLSDEFNRPLAIDLDPKASVALGAAFATAALEDASDQDPAAAGAADQEVGSAVQGSGVPAARTNAAGFSLPSARRPATAPRHGPVSMAPNKRLGIRVGAIAAAVALLGVATASATNAPNLFPAISALAGDPRAEAAEKPVAAPATPSATPEPGGSASEGPVGPLAPDEGQTFLERAGVKDAASEDKPKAAEESPADGTSRSTSKASEAARPEAPTAEEAPGGAPAGAGSSPAPSSQAPASAQKPGTSPVGPTPPAPFPPSSPSPSPTVPVSQAPSPAPVPTPAPPVVQPTTPPPAPEPTPDPTPDPTTPPPPSPDPSPTTEPASEPPPPAVEPTPTDPPAPGGDPTASSAPAEA
ncbi:Hsp70 family protein [Arthrobacter sp. NPDC092385]|uniref:Hsp70 family protein n=1 Tax=Arthrobacter sp. NPDC092385 TaxID=3363943 RepID=UPI0037F95257